MMLWIGCSQIHEFDLVCSYECLSTDLSSDDVAGGQSKNEMLDGRYVILNLVFTDVKNLLSACSEVEYTKWFARADAAIDSTEDEHLARVLVQHTISL